MTARTTLSVLAGILAGGIAPSVVAGDYGVSFHYRSHAPRYYSDRATRCYATSVPRGYVYYDRSYACDQPVVYVRRSTPCVVVYDDCYPTTYRTTYTRSDRYTRPVRHSRATAHHYRSGHRVHHYRQRATSRHHYSSSRSGIRVYGHHGGSRYHRGGSHDRCRHWRDHRRGPSIRLRIGRR